MNPKLANLLLFVFEQIPVLKWFNGKKRVIGKILTGTGLVLEAAKELQPHNQYLQVTNGLVTALVGSAIWGVGVGHAKAKDEREGVPSED